MADQDATIFFKRFNAADFRVLETALVPLGFGATYPGSDQIAALRTELDQEDPDADYGDTLLVPRSWLDARLASQIDTSLMLYRKDWTSLVVSVRFADWGTTLTLDLSGLDAGEREDVLAAFVGYAALAANAHQVYGLVVDLDGSEVDWEAIVVRGVDVPYVPRALAVSASQSEQFIHKPDTRVVPLGELLLVTPG